MAAIQIPLSVRVGGFDSGLEALTTRFAAQAHVQHEDFVRWVGCKERPAVPAAAEACGGAEQLEVDRGRWRLMMRRQLRKFAQRKLAEAARYEHATGEARAMLMATKLSTLDLDAVRSDMAALRADVRALAGDVGAVHARLDRQEGTLDRIARALGADSGPEGPACYLGVAPGLVQLHPPDHGLGRYGFGS
jgi:hypothetical protein